MRLSSSSSCRCFATWSAFFLLLQIIYLKQRSEQYFYCQPKFTAVNRKTIFGSVLEILDIFLKCAVIEPSAFPDFNLVVYI